MDQTAAYTPGYSESAIPCLICRQPLQVRLAHGRKSKKPFVMLLCARDGRHFRAFINDREFVAGVLARLEGHTPVEQREADLDDAGQASSPSTTSQDRRTKP